MSATHPRPPGMAGRAAPERPTAGSVMDPDRRRRADLIRSTLPIAVPWGMLLASAQLLLLSLARPLGPSSFAPAAAVAAILVIVGSGALATRVRRRWASISPRAAVAGVVGVTLLLQVDILIAWLRLPAVDAGTYAGAAVLTRWLLLVPFVLMLLALRRPEVGDRDPFRSLHRSLAATGIVVVVGCLALSFFREGFADAVLGSGFTGAASYVPRLAIAGAFLAIVWQLSFVHLAVASRAHLLVITVAAIEAIDAAIATTSAWRIAALGVAGAAAGASLQYVGARAITRWSPPLSALRPHLEVTATPSQTDDDVELSLILPCFNLGSELRPFLTRLLSELRDAGRFELIVVSDGSTDDSVEVARQLDSPSIRVLHYTERAGKGHALRVGLGTARGAFIGFIDADGDIDPRAVGPFLSLMRLYGPDVVLGSKRHPMSVVSYPPMRRLMSWAYHKLTRLLFRINVRDTQTGLKLIRRDVLADVLPRMFEKRYAFDLELLVVARLLGYTNVFEAPVKIDFRFSSNVNPNAVFRILLDTAAIFYRRYILDTYRHAGDRLLIVRDEEVGSGSATGID
jgi:glycosyltransferase involved in cell wall biosynthesis